MPTEQALFDFAASTSQAASHKALRFSINDWKSRKPVKGAVCYRWKIGWKTVYSEILPAGLKYRHKPHARRGNFGLNMLTLSVHASDVDSLAESLVSRVSNVRT